MLACLRTIPRSCLIIRGRLAKSFAVTRSIQQELPFCLLLGFIDYFLRMVYAHARVRGLLIPGQR